MPFKRTFAFWHDKSRRMENITLNDIVLPNPGTIFGHDGPNCTAAKQSYGAAVGYTAAELIDTFSMQN